MEKVLMEILDLIFLSFIQGITEFLPVSSSAHLIILGEYLESEEQDILFDVSVHLGTLFAATIYFRKEVEAMLMGFTLKEEHKDGTKLLVNIFVAVCPILLIGFLSRDLVDLYLRNPLIIAYATIIFGVVLYVADKANSKSNNLNSISLIQSLVIGLSQCLALIPGTSRSGITISAALFLGISREAAAKFSFLLAIPTIGAIAFSEIIKLNFNQLVVQADKLLLSILISFFVAYFSIDIFLKILDRIGFTPFVVYRIVLGLLLILFWI
jgi:undecaprenyl-diphosphatase